MLFKVVTKEAFRSLVEIMIEAGEIVAPVKIGERADGKPIHQYLPVDCFDEIDLDYETTHYSAKTYFLPYRENLSTYEFGDKDWEQQIRYRLQPRAIIGLHACDINGLLKLDKVFMKDLFPSPYYVSRRRNTFIVGIDHDPCEGAFCRALGTDVATHGFDLFLTDLEDRYFVSVGSDRGFSTLGKVETSEITEEDRKRYLEVRRRISNGFPEQIAVHNLPQILDIEFESSVWKKWGEKCLSCGTCAMVCPTCYCYGVCERVSMDFRGGAKFKQLYSCNLLDFARVAGGHNFRPDRATRLKYRYYHQHRGFVESYEEPKCVGCNRCGRACLAGINPADVITDLQGEERHGRLVPSL